MAPKLARSVESLNKEPDSPKVRPRLFEFEDFEWVPATIRDLGADWLQFMSNKLNIYRAVAAKLPEALDKSGEREVLNLCWGGGGGWLSIISELRAARPLIADRQS